MRHVSRTSTSCRAYSPQNRNDVDIVPRRAHVYDDFRRTIDAEFDATFDRIERQMERAVERMERQIEAGSGSRQYKREWSNEGSSGREYFHESIVVSGPSTVVPHRQGSSSPVGGYLGVMMATAAAVLYVQKARAFWDVAGETVYRKEHLPRLAIVAPLLSVVSRKFRQNWRAAAERKGARDTRGIESRDGGDSLTDV